MPRSIQPRVFPISHGLWSVFWFPFTRFERVVDLFNQIGHGFCQKCLHETREQPRCAICRHPKGSQEPRQIYVTFVEPTPKKKQRPLTVAEGLDAIDCDAPAISLRRAGLKIRDQAKLADDRTSVGPV